MADTLTNTELLAENARLKAALAPFAKVAERFQPTGRELADKRHLQAILWSAADRRYEITAADCIAAQEALQETEPLSATAWVASLGAPDSTEKVYGRTWQAALVKAAEAGCPAENTYIVPLYSFGQLRIDTQDDTLEDTQPESKIVVLVEGGNVQGLWSSFPVDEVVMIDRDNEAAGDWMPDLEDETSLLQAIY